MNEHVVTPEVRGIDLSFRPRTYFGPLPLETHLLAHVTGHERRELLRLLLAAGGAEQAPPALVVSTLREDDRRDLGRIHPAMMGGEYLPPLDPGETEIARISLASVTADQISVRAKPVPDGIAYRIIDEYDNDCMGYQCRPSITALPLTLRELVEMLEGACEGGGAVLSHIIGNIECGGAYVDELRNFVRVSSEFYPELAGYYEWRIEAWFDEHYPAEDTEAEEQRALEEEQRRAFALEPFASRIAEIESAWKSQYRPSGWASGMAMLHRSSVLRGALQDFVVEHGAMPTGVLRVDRGDGVGADTFDLDAIRRLIDKAGTDSTPPSSELPNELHTPAAQNGSEGVREQEDGHQ